MTVRSRALFAIAALVLASCGVRDDEADTDSTSTTDIPATTTTLAPATTPAETTMPDDTELIRAAIEDLSRRLLTPDENIEVVETRSVQWPDGSLGCPEEGVSYTQAIVDGTQVLLGSDGKIYDYHAGDEGEIFLCPSDEKDGGYDFVPPPGFDQ